jgi:hypothetical protein
MSIMAPPSARFQNKTATILAGESLSSVIDCSDGALVFLHMPSDWTPAMLSFQVSPDGVKFNDLVDSHAIELVMNVAAGTSVRVDPKWSPVTYLKIRSGERDAPVVQDADQTITITIDTAA